MNLPFKYGKIIEDDFFVNRTSELDYLKRNIKSKINLTLISPRRWGKSSLVSKIARDMTKDEKNIKFCFIDLYNVRNEEEFYNYFATEILKASYSKWEERIENAKLFFKQILPKFSFGLDPNQEFSISFDWESVKKNPQEILDLPEIVSKTKKIQLVICLDEFQNLSYFDEPLNFQKKARAAWQKHQHCSYVLYGSKRHMMAELFENKSMPFYKFGEIILLSKIETQHWQKYIQEKFKSTKKNISPELAEILIQKVENHSYFVQQLANAVWLEANKTCTKDDIDNALEKLLLQYELFFSKEVDGLSNLQLNLLKALAADEKELSGKKTIKKYNLSSSASVNRSKEALIQKEIIDTFEKKIEFIDPLFKIWINNTYNRKL
ncbi:ATP-binding protein [Flavobacterium sp.]|uniref:AAA family ATPase n=1 Tax=Flavobacterium sp. TaxID=239 RepID=UPI0035298E97